MSQPEQHLVIVIGIVSAVLTLAGFRFISRAAGRPVRNLLGAPPCDRCGKNTGKPWLWRSPKTRWNCAACDAEVAAILLSLSHPAFDRRGWTDGSST